MSTLKQSGNYDQAMNQLKNLTSNCELHLTEYKKKTTKIDALRDKNPLDDYPDLGRTIADLKNKQNSNLVITKVIEWLKTDSAPTANIYSTGEEQKYLKEFR